MQSGLEGYRKLPGGTMPDGWQGSSTVMQGSKVVQSYAVNGVTYCCCLRAGRRAVSGGLLTHHSRSSSMLAGVCT